MGQTPNIPASATSSRSDPPTVVVQWGSMMPFLNLSWPECSSYTEFLVSCSLILVVGEKQGEREGRDTDMYRGTMV